MIFISFSAHKFSGPKGVGGLFIKKDLSLLHFLHGGEHMGGRGSGPWNVLLYAAMGEALRIANTMLEF